MALRDLIRDLARRAAPGVMADRARRYEQGYRDRSGVTVTAEAIEEDRRVGTGPFAGLLLGASLAEIDAAPAKLLGSYEAELSGIFRAAIDGELTTFVDVGCADGYYAVGMAVADAGITTHAFDIASSARRVCREAAEANGVADRVVIGSRCDARALRELPLEGALLLLDIEGAELEFLDAETVSLLAGCQVLIEVHEDQRPGAGAALQERFESTHRSQVITQATRDHDAYARLASLPQEQARLAVHEHRGPLLHWLVLRPR